MADDELEDEVSELKKPGVKHTKRTELDALDALEEQGHLVPAHVIEQVDTHIAKWHAREDSRLDESKEYTKDIKRILKGDAGEGYTYVRLLGQYEREQIVPQPANLTDGDDSRITPDFAVKSYAEPGAYQEIVDAKAWALIRPRDTDGEKVPYADFMRSLLDHPDPARLVNMGELKRVVNRYSSSPQLASDGRVVLYFPEDTLRYAPQLARELESWSGSEMAHRRTIEIRSMGVWNDDLWQAAGKRHQR